MRANTKHSSTRAARSPAERGNAAAVVTLQLHEAGDRTRVTVDTDLKVVGKLAQFGSGMLQQVSEKLLGQFVDALEAKLIGGEAAAAAPVTEATPSGSTTPGAAPKMAPTAEPEAIDLLELAGGTAVTKYAAGGAAALVLLILLFLVRRRRNR